jgi:4'-phosphopantetheinyl transferase
MSPTRELKPGEVHVWRVRLTGEDEFRWREVLDDSERDLADRYRFAADRRRSIITRGILRTLLAGYTGGDVQSIRFHSNEFGKPSLIPAASRFPVEFNVSHSGDFSLLAFARGMEVGVDIEQLTTERNIAELARIVLSREEAVCFDLLPHDQKQRMLFRIWTCKEAVVKAVGNGLSIPLESFEVDLDINPNSTVQPIRCAAQTWFLHEIDPGDHYAAAIATKSAGAAVILFDWPLLK